MIESDRAKTQLTELGRAWAEAELRGDTAFLERTLADDFVGIGPLGFMLTREAWLQRHSSGDMKYDSHDLEEVTTRIYGDAAIITGSLTQKASYRGQDSAGQFRTMLVWVRQQGQWRLAGLQLSPIAQRPPGAQPPR